MIKHQTTYRVPYADTDQMGVVYYANYLEYFERARTEMLRDAGLPYAELERLGIFLPVNEAKVKYVSSAFYDDLLTFYSWVGAISRVKLEVKCEVFREDKLLASGYVVLVSADRNFRPVRAPEILLEKCKLFTEGC